MKLLSTERVNTSIARLLSLLIALVFRLLRQMDAVVITDPRILESPNPRRPEGFTSFTWCAAVHVGAFLGLPSNRSAGKCRGRFFVGPIRYDRLD